MNRSLVFDLATAGFIGKREDSLFLGPGGSDKSHLAQAIDLFASLCARARTIGGLSYLSCGPACGSRSEKDGQAFSVPVPSAAGSR